MRRKSVFPMERERSISGSSRMSIGVRCSLYVSRAPTGDPAPPLCDVYTSPSSLGAPRSDARRHTENVRESAADDEGESGGRASRVLWISPRLLNETDAPERGDTRAADDGSTRVPAARVPGVPPIFVHPDRAAHEPPVRALNGEESCRAKRRSRESQARARALSLDHRKRFTVQMTRAPRGPRPRFSPSRCEKSL